MVLLTSVIGPQEGFKCLSIVTELRAWVIFSITAKELFSISRLSQLFETNKPR
jgi:hypothetical protein